MPSPPFIISASRRTDVPALQGEWFSEQLDKGWVEWRNPFDSTVQRVSLRREDVIGFVFWSKNFDPFAGILEEITRRGFPWYGLWTITGLGTEFEPNLPPLDQRIDHFISLTKRFGPNRFTWRFDPIMLTSVCDETRTLSRFSQLCSRLSGSTTECITSFVQFYGKVRRRFAALRGQTGIEVTDPPVEEKRALLCRMAELSGAHGIRLDVCCQDELVSGPVGKAHCVDIDRLQALSQAPLAHVSRKGTRKECGCSYSRDIGAYHTCSHECVYCYANL